jgi:hypothetical protein
MTRPAAVSGSAGSGRRGTRISTFARSTTTLRSFFPIRRSCDCCPCTPGGGRGTDGRGLSSSSEAADVAAFLVLSELDNPPSLALENGRQRAIEQLAIGRRNLKPKRVVVRWYHLAFTLKARGADKFGDEFSLTVFDAPGSSHGMLPSNLLSTLQRWFTSYPASRPGWCARSNSLPVVLLDAIAQAPLLTSETLWLKSPTPIGGRWEHRWRGRD